MNAKSEIDRWYQDGKHTELTRLLNEPIMQKAVSMLVLAGLPAGSPNGDMEKEAIYGAERRGFYNFYRSLIGLTNLPATAKPPQKEWAVQQPNNPHEPSPDDLLPH